MSAFSMNDIEEMCRLLNVPHMLKRRDVRANLTAEERVKATEYERRLKDVINAYNETKFKGGFQKVEIRTQKDKQYLHVLMDNLRWEWCNIPIKVMLSDDPVKSVVIYKLEQDKAALKRDIAQFEKSISAMRKRMTKVDKDLEAAKAG